MYKMRRGEAGCTKFGVTFEYKDYMELYMLLVKANSGILSGFKTNPGEVYVIFKCQGKKEKVIQIYQITENKMLFGLLPNDWVVVRQNAEKRRGL